MIKKNAVILLDSYFQVIYKLFKLFLMIIPWVWYPFSDKRMKVLGSWVLSPRSYKKKVAKSVFEHWVSILFSLHHVGVAEFFPIIGNILLAMLRVELKCELEIPFTE